MIIDNIDTDIFYKINKTDILLKYLFVYLKLYHK